MNVRTNRPSIARLSSDLCAVINRVRRAFGLHSMRAFAVRPSIRQAEQHIDHTARQLLRGEADLRDWHRALCQYETSWMIELETLRRSEGDRHAA